MSFRYNSKVRGNKNCQEFMVTILNGRGNPVDFFTHSLTEKQLLEINEEKMGAHNFGVKGWSLDPANQYEGYAEKEKGDK
jgi:hypothetical protein